jgi:Flagellar biosynthesis protein, FliO
LAVIAIVVLWVLWILLRKFRSGLFVSGGGKGNLPRLAVIDAVPVDSSRRLILVRRDDVEHLIMIGGPSDLVVESGIGKTKSVVQDQMPRQPAATSQPQTASQQVSSAPAQRPPLVAAREAVADAERGRLVRSPEPQISERRTEPAMSAPTPPPVIAPPPITPPLGTQAVPSQPGSPTAVITPSVSTAPPTTSRGELDLDKLLDELRPNPLQDRS